jgi:hypothetical protein
MMPLPGWMLHQQAEQATDQSKFQQNPKIPEKKRVQLRLQSRVTFLLRQLQLHSLPEVNFGQ